MRIAAYGAFIALILVTPASVQSTMAAGETGIHPDCVGQKYDLAGKRRCTCALETGGTINPDGRGWKYFNTAAYSACMTRKGWL